MNNTQHTERAPCPHCRLQYQCVCSRLPSIIAPFHLALLTHENELNRETNTGQWLKKSLAATSVHIWQRTQPCPELLAMLQSEQYQAYLLFPSEESRPVEQLATTAQQTGKTPLFIILDGTWQEAKKMLRKSAWLKTLPLAHINPSQNSGYQLRRNQDQGHLCTLEVGCEILQAVGEVEPAQQLLDFFRHYMQAFKADKSGHALRVKTGE